MASLQNIGAENKDDTFYRYKMPKMATKLESRGNGVKTNIVNMAEIATALDRPPSYVMHYFCSEPGACSELDNKTGTFRINGAHDFIKKFVQCYGCGNPETAVKASSSNNVSLECRFVSEVDMMEKLTKLIVRNHGEVKKRLEDKKFRRAEKERLRAAEKAMI